MEYNYYVETIWSIGDSLSILMMTGFYFLSCFIMLEGGMPMENLEKLGLLIEIIKNVPAISAYRISY